MKDKEKQIEEMAKHGCYDGCASGLRKFCEEYDGKPCKNIVRIAMGLFEQGYRKLPEDSVVLTREEYESDLTLQYDTGYEFGSKETAEKFYDKICTNTCVFTTPPDVSEDYNKGYVQAMADHSERIDQVAKQFGVEIKE